MDSGQGDCRCPSVMHDAPGPTRTGDLRLRRPALYPSELRAHISIPPDRQRWEFFTTALNQTATTSQRSFTEYRQSSLVVFRVARKDAFEQSLPARFHRLFDFVYQPARSLF